MQHCHPPPPAAAVCRRLPPSLPLPAAAQHPLCHVALLQAPIQATVLSCSSTMLSVRLQELGNKVRAGPVHMLLN